MNNFLDQRFLGNTVEQYLITAIVIIGILLIKKYVANYFSDIIYRLFNKRWRTLDKMYLRQHLTKPLATFIAVLVSVAALDKLSWPQEYDFSIYRITIKDVLKMTGTFLIIFTFFNAVIKMVDFIGMLLKNRYAAGDDARNHQVVFFFKDLIKVLIGIIGVLFVLKYTFNYDIKGLLTGLSIVGAAVALALKQSLENLIASFIIFFDKPFQAGDVVKLNNYSGTVERIGLRSTRIRSDAKTYITVPNSQMADSVLDNLSNRTQRRADLRLEIEPATPPDLVNKLIDGVRSILSKKNLLNFNLFLTDISSTAIVITGDYYTLPNDLNLFNTTREKINLEILQLIDDLGIDIAGKTTEIKISGEQQKTPEKKPII